jgi:hypothetical protein
MYNSGSIRGGGMDYWSPCSAAVLHFSLLSLLLPPVSVRQLCAKSLVSSGRGATLMAGTHWDRYDHPPYLR